VPELMKAHNWLTILAYKGKSMALWDSQGFIQLVLEKKDTTTLLIYPVNSIEPDCGPQLV